MISSRTRRAAALTAVAISATFLAACTPAAPEPEEIIELTLANSYPDDHPHNRCGATVIAEELNGRDIGLDVQVFSNSQLGADADRFTSLIAGDIDMDFQGPSAISATYAPIGVVSSAFGFSDPDHLFAFFDGEGSQGLKDGLLEETGVRFLEPYYFGARTFSANSAIRTPADLEGLRIRFPDTPIHLANAEALGATPVAVAFEELFLALEQGIADGQDNPVPTIASLSLDEVQTHVSLDNHLIDFQAVIINDEKWQSLSEEQQTAITEVVHDTRAGDRECIEQATQDIIDDWKSTGAVEVVEDVDRDAFEQRAEEFFLNYWKDADLELYQAIRDSA